MNFLDTNLKTWTVLFGLALCVSACKSYQDTPEDTKHLHEFHLVNFEQQDGLLKEGELNLFVDYSTCCALGQNSMFFQAVSASLVDRTTAYYAIQGPEITNMDIAANGGVYTLLRNIKEVNYAELAQAAKQAVSGDCEAVILTDGEYYTPSIAKGHDNDPYLAEAFKSWILRGHDVHIISEPYSESNKGKIYSKKRFYILFTDDRMSNNIYSRILRTVDLRLYPDVDEFHISASHPQLKGDGNNSSIQNEVLQSRVKGFGTFEIEDWNGCDWGTIENFLVNAIDDNTGEPLEGGKSIIEMGLDKNSFGCYRIKSVGLKVYDINKEYNDFYVEKENGEKIGQKEYQLRELENFMQIDSDEFDKHSKIKISFNRDWFDPNELTGKPYNYFKIDIFINEVQQIFSQHEDKFEFESIGLPDTKNISVISSIKQCLADDAVIKKIMGQVIYSIYVKSEQN